MRSPSSSFLLGTLPLKAASRTRGPAITYAHPSSGLHSDFNYLSKGTKPRPPELGDAFMKLISAHKRAADMNRSTLNQGEIDQTVLTETGARLGADFVQ